MENMYRLWNKKGEEIGIIKCDKALLVDIVENSERIDDSSLIEKELVALGDMAEEIGLDLYVGLNREYNTNDEREWLDEDITIEDVQEKLKEEVEALKGKIEGITEVVEEKFEQTTDEEEIDSMLDEAEENIMKDTALDPTPEEHKLTASISGSFKRKYKLENGTVIEEKPYDHKEEFVAYVECSCGESFYDIDTAIKHLKEAGDDGETDDE